jgi:hypothetical protein
MHRWAPKMLTAAREARRARGQSIGRLKALDKSKDALTQRMQVT